MCFYRDTQAALTQNNLRNLIKQRNYATSKTTKDKNASESEAMPSSEPYKKLHLTKTLYQDLLLLSTNDMVKLEEMSTDDFSREDDMSEPKENQTSLQSSGKVGTIGQKFAVTREDLQVSTLPEVLNNYYVEGHYIDSTNHQFFENILISIEKTNKTLNEFKNSQSTTKTKVESYIKSVSLSQTQLMQESPFERLEKQSHMEKNRQRYNPNPTSFELLSHFTNGRTEFPYELVLKSEIPTPVFRERNLKVEVSLVRKSDNTVMTNHGKMILQMSLFTCELPPHVIVRNKAGNKVLQGEDESELKNGLAVFDKIQINEVTSKFINGSITLVVMAKRPFNFGTSLESLHLKNSVRIEDIKPLLVSKLIVKSKKKNPSGKKKSPVKGN